MNNTKNVNPMCDDEISQEEFEEIINNAIDDGANLKLPDPGLVELYRNIKDRTIYITRGIDERLFNEAKLILRWNKEDNEKGLKPEERKPIKIFIHSYGGYLEEALAFADIVRLSKTPIITINMGQALSGGAIIFISGHKGNRYCLKDSVVLVHEGSGGTEGSFSQSKAQQDNWGKRVDLMYKNISDNTGIDKKTLTRWKSKETYLYSEDQIKYGIADKIVEDIEEIL